MSYVGEVISGGDAHLVTSTAYGTCSTVASTADKVVTLPNYDALIEGTTVHVKFLYSNTAADATLNVNGTGALPIYTDGVNPPGTTALTSWPANSMVAFTYDGTAWRMNDVGASASNVASNLLNLVYPVGAIYLSTNSTSPASLFGGTWQQISDKFLLTAGSTYTAGSTGGEANHLLTAAEMPSHVHEVGAHAHGLNSHVHSVGAHDHGLNNHVHSVGGHTHGLNGHTHSIPSLSGSTNGAGGHTHEIFTTGGSGETWGYKWEYSSSSDSSDGVYSAGSHSHSVSTSPSTTGGNSGTTSTNSAFNTGGASGSTANSAAFNSGGPSVANTANSSAFNSGSVGGGGSHNNMPPYLVVYAWKRTA